MLLIERLADRRLIDSCSVYQVQARSAATAPQHVGAQQCRKPRDEVEHRLVYIFSRVDGQIDAAYKSANYVTASAYTRCESLQYTYIFYPQTDHGMLDE